MAYESVQKPASTRVPVQKKASQLAPPGVTGHRVETSPQAQEPTLSNKLATDDDWLMKSPLFTGHHLLQKYATPVSVSSERQSDLTTGIGQEVERQEENVQRTESDSPHSLLPTPYSLPLQAKLTIGEVGDKYEQEADSVAAEVVSRINTPQSQTVQREEMPGDEEEMQMKPVFDTIQREEMPGDEEELQMKPVSDTIQRLEMPGDEDELQMKPMVQRVQDGGGMAASTDLEGAIQGARGSGQPLDESVKEPMEGAFGADFSGVRVHTDATSDQLNQSIQAKAFTTGSDIFFRSGAYDPGSRGGQELLAHELTHVVQQKADRQSSIQRLKEVTLNQTEAANYKKWQVWYQKKSTTIKIKTKIEEIFDRAKTWLDFDQLMLELYNNIENPGLGFNVQQFFDQKVQQFLAQNPPQVTQSGGWAKPTAPPPQWGPIKMGASSATQSATVVGVGQLQQDWAKIQKDYLSMTKKPGKVSNVRKSDLTKNTDATWEIAVKFFDGTEDIHLLLHYHPKPVNNNFLHFKATDQSQGNYKVDWQHWLLKEAGVDQTTFK